MKGKKLLSGILLLFCLFILSCTNKENNTLVKEVKDYQEEINAILKVIAEQKADIRHQIAEATIENQDTFDLARNLVPLKTANFRLSARYDALTDALEAYDKKEINDNALKTELYEKKEAVKAIVSEYDLERAD